MSISRTTAPSCFERLDPREHSGLDLRIELRRVEEIRHRHADAQASDVADQRRGVVRHRHVGGRRIAGVVPAMTPSIAAQSQAVRAIGPTLSRL